jgi:4-amino-4-deoxy-L-arabinose transferase-like glycosyltransferase
MTGTLSRRELLALGLILATAGVLRIVGAGYGLPYPLLNPDEASIVPRAWRIGHLEALDPGWYDYPSLLMYLVAPLQAFMASPSYGAARVVAVVVGLGGVAAAWWLGRRAYGPGAGLIAAAAVAVATVHVAYSRVAVTDVAVTLGITAALALALTDRLEWAGLAAGLAASAKYPGAVVALPLLVAGWQQWRRLLTAGALAVLAFVLTSPFVVIHVGAAWDDLSRVQRLARAGWLGFEHDHATPLAFADRLWEALGPFLLVAGAGLVVAVVRRSRADLVLASFVLVYALYLLPLEAHFDRYVLPLIPVLGVFGGLIRPLRPLAAVLLVVPVVWAVGDARELTRTDTRVRAAAWLDAHVPRRALLAADPATLPLEHRRIVRLELPGPGRPSDPRRSLAALRDEGVRWVLVSGAVTDRVLAAREDYPAESAFYDALARKRPAFELVPDGAELAGPWVRVYRL